MTKTPLMRAIENHRGTSIESIITEAMDSGLKQYEIANNIGVTESCLSRWMQKLKLRT